MEAVADLKPECLSPTQAGRQALEEWHIEGLPGPAARDADHACRPDQCRPSPIHTVVNEKLLGSRKYLFLWFAECEPILI
jgi:hypothetical protein